MQREKEGRKNNLIKLVYVHFPVIRLFSVLVALSPLNSSHSRLPLRLEVTKKKIQIANPTDDEKRELGLILVKI